MQRRDEERRFFSRRTGVLARTVRDVGRFSREPFAVVSTPSFQIRIPQSLLHILLETDSLGEVLAIHWDPEQLALLDPRIRVVARYPVLAARPLNWVRIELSPLRYDFSPEIYGWTRDKDTNLFSPLGCLCMYSNSYRSWVFADALYSPTLAVVNGRVIDDDDAVGKETKQNRTEFNDKNRWNFHCIKGKRSRVPIPGYVVKDEDMEENARHYLFRFRRDGESPPFTQTDLWEQIHDTTRVYDSTRSRQSLPSLFGRIRENRDRVHCFVFASNEGCLYITMQSLYPKSGRMTGFGRILLKVPRQNQQDPSLALASPLAEEPDGILRKKKIHVTWTLTTLTVVLLDLEVPLYLASPETHCLYPRITVKADFGLDPENSSSHVLLEAMSRTGQWAIDLHDTRVIVTESKSRVIRRPLSFLDSASEL